MILCCHFSLPQFYNFYHMFYFYVCLTPHMHYHFFVLVSQLYFLIIDFTFLEKFLVHSKTEQEVQRFSVYTMLAYMQNSSTTDIHSKNSTLVAICEPILTHQCYPKIVDYIRVHSCFCTFSGF